MSELIARLASIALLRQGPQDLPAGRATLLFTIALYVAVTAFNLQRGESHPAPVLVLVLAVGLPLILVWIVLRLKQFTARWEQTLTALFGTSALLSILTLPISLAAAGTNSPLTILVLLSFFYSFAIDGHIWRHAMEVSFAAGLAISVLLFVLSLFLISSLAGPL